MPASAEWHPRGRPSARPTLEVGPCPRPDGSASRCVGRSLWGGLTRHGGVRRAHARVRAPLHPNRARRAGDRPTVPPKSRTHGSVATPPGRPSRPPFPWPVSRHVGRARRSARRQGTGVQRAVPLSVPPAGLPHRGRRSARSRDGVRLPSLGRAESRVESRPSSATASFDPARGGSAGSPPPVSRRGGSRRFFSSFLAGVEPSPVESGPRHGPGHDPSSPHGGSDRGQLDPRTPPPRPAPGRFGKRRRTQGPSDSRGAGGDVHPLPGIGAEAS